jgi:hypothetical protein
MNAPTTAVAVPGAGRFRRRPRDWVVDGLLFLAAVTFGLLAVGGRLEASTPVAPAWLLGADAVAGMIGCAGLWLRRRWPVGLALVLIAISSFSEPGAPTPAPGPRAPRAPGRPPTGPARGWPGWPSVSPWPGGG